MINDVSIANLNFAYVLTNHSHLTNLWNCNEINDIHIYTGGGLTMSNKLLPLL